MPSARRPGPTSRAKRRRAGRRCRESFDDGGFSGGSLDRPALQLLLDAIRARRIDVVVVYKVDRLTRSLADFAKLVELFDAHGVSFVSVTQSFNTTTSMGRLTLNVLLSFAQFEREVTSERIRDKIAASKRRGLWVGGPVPLGYAARNKKLVVVEEEAERVRLIFQLYLELGSLGRLLPELRRRGVVTKRRELTGGRVIGGIPFTRGPLAYLLRNRFYLGEVVYRGKVSQGEHAAILDPELFAAVQERLTQQHHGFVRARAGSQALLLGRLFDDRGNRMSPTYANKQGVRYRYYVTCALAQGRPEAAGSVTRVSAAEVEEPVLRALKEHRLDLAATPDRELIERCVELVVLHPTAIEIKLQSASCPVDCGEVHRANQDDHSECTESAAGSAPILRIAWTRTPTKRGQQIITPAQSEHSDHRPIRAETRATLVRAIALGRRWLDELATGAMATPQAIAQREGCSQRHVERTISLAFLAPDLIRAAVKGRLPRGVGVSRLVDPPIEWTRQWRMFGLPGSVALAGCRRVPARCLPIRPRGRTPGGRRPAGPACRSQARHAPVPWPASPWPRCRRGFAERSKSSESRASALFGA